jgi:hypothetical protein
MIVTPKTLHSGSSWLLLHQHSDGTVTIEAGHGTDTVATLVMPLGLRWYRGDGNLPDGERRAAWIRAEMTGDPASPWLLHGQIADPVGGSWTAVTAVRVDADNGFRLTTSFTRHGSARAASLRVHTRFAAPPARAFTLAPGSVYHGNRADVVVPRGYCPLLTADEVAVRETSPRRVIADIPRLDASTWWTVHLWGHQAASASVSAFDPVVGTGVHLGYARTEGGRILGVIHTADPDTDFHQVTVENPCVRERRYRNCRWESAPDRPHQFSDGERAVIELRLAPASATDIPSFVTSWQPERTLRRMGLAPGQEGPLPSTPNVMPRSHASDLAVAVNDRHLWNETEGFYYTVHPRENHPRELILGWGSGTMAMLPMFRLGTPGIRARLRRMMCFLLDHAQAPTGLFYGARVNGRWLGAYGNLDSFWAMNSLTPRRTTDTIVYGFAFADALRAEDTPDDNALADRLDAALLRACEALVRVFQRDGEIPFLLDPHTARAVWRGGHGGCRAIGGLVLAAERFSRPDLLTAARDLAAHCVRTGLARGETWGGPADVMQGTTDNESLTALCEGLVLLHRATGESDHLLRAIQACDLLATWALDEHIAFPHGCVLGRNGFNPFGALVASTQNCWGTPGLCVNSGRFLLELYECTGEPRFLDLLSDIVRVPLQMMIRPGQSWGQLEPGQMTECSSFNDVPREFGDAYLNEATWPVNAMLVAEIELPSIYVDASVHRVWKLDHLDADLAADGALTVSNHTAFPARIRVRWRDGRAAAFNLAPGATHTLPPS